MYLLDRLVNFLSGLGTAKDKTSGNIFGARVLTKLELEAMYRDDWIAGKIVDIPPFDMTRAWRNWQAKEGQIEALEAAERALGIRFKTAWCLQRARLYGGAALYIGTNDRDPAEPLEIERMPKGGVSYLLALTCHDLPAGEIERDPQSPFYGCPRWYEMHGRDRPVLRIHPSRIIRFVGRPYPDPMEAPDGWGDPILRVGRPTFARGFRGRAPRSP